MTRSKMNPMLVPREESVPGREEEIEIDNCHFINGNPLKAPFPEGIQQAQFGLGCFWGAERKFWQFPGVFSTAVGYAGGYTVNPSYEEVCSGYTAHTEAVLIAFNPVEVSYNSLLQLFWESHDPTQGLRQGNDVGSQYRSAIFCTSDEQLLFAQQSRAHFQKQLDTQGFPQITTEIKLAEQFFYAEQYHQQYLAKNPGGYCGLGGTGVAFTP